MDVAREIESEVPPPPPLASRFVRLVLGFGVSVAVGLAPFLGKLSIPGFDALLTVFPEELHYSLIPLSSFLMGLVAAGVQFLHGERLRDTHLRFAFLFAYAAVFAGFVWLLLVYDERTERIKIPAAQTARTFVIAPEGRLPKCPCPSHWEDDQCIGETLKAERVSQCWGSKALRRSRKVLRGGYMLLTGGFGAVIGLLLLQVGVRQAEAAAQRDNAEKPKQKQGKKKQGRR